MITKEFSSTLLVATQPLIVGKEGAQKPSYKHEKYGCTVT
jgi:hypothetical protein